MWSFSLSHFLDFTQNHTMDFGMSSQIFYAAILIGCNILNIVKSLSLLFLLAYFKLRGIFRKWESPNYNILSYMIHKFDLHQYKIEIKGKSGLRRKIWTQWCKTQFFVCQLRSPRLKIKKYFAAVSESPPKDPISVNDSSYYFGCRHLLHHRLNYAFTLNNSPITHAYM